MDFKLAIALPLSNDREYSPFWDSFLVMEKPERFLYLRPEFPTNIETVRNNLVVEALEGGASHILFMDTDQIYPRNTISKLVETIEMTGAKVVSTIVHRRYVPFDPLIFNVGERRKLIPYPYEKLYLQEYIKDVVTGCGCIIYDLDVFRAIPKPWFEDKTGIIDEETKRKGPGEDIGFCFKLRDAGFEIWVNTSLDIGHLAMLNINRGFYKLFRTLKEVVNKNPELQTSKGE